MNKNNSQLLANAIGRYFAIANDLQKEMFLRAGEKCRGKKFAVANDLQKILFSQTKDDCKCRGSCKQK